MLRACASRGSSAAGGSLGGLKRLPLPLQLRIRSMATTSGAGQGALTTFSKSALGKTMQRIQFTPKDETVFTTLIGGAAMVLLRKGYRGELKAPENAPPAMPSATTTVSEQPLLTAEQDSAGTMILQAREEVVAADPETVDGQFDGTWVLDRARSQPPEPQLKALGVRWLLRKAAALAQPTVTISVEEGTWHEHIAAGLFNVADQHPLDDQAVRRTEQGYCVQERTRVEEEGRCVVTRIEYAASGHKTMIRRYVEPGNDGGLVYKVVNRLTCPDGRQIDRVSYFNPA